LRRCRFVSRSGLRGEARVAGIAEYRPERHFSGDPAFTLEQWADLAALALGDAGVEAKEVDGIVTVDFLREAKFFVPASVAEYCGFAVNFAEKVDLGGASPIGMIWRAAAAIELGLCNVVVGALPARPVPPEPRKQDDSADSIFGTMANEWGSPQAEFEIPFGNVAQNAGYAMIAQRYAAAYGYDPRAMAKISADQRISTCANPEAIFYGRPVSIDDVLNSRVIADPLHLLEIVMPCTGGGAFVVTSRARAADARHPPVRIAGFGEHLTHKTPTYMPDLTRTPVAPAATRAFGMAGIHPEDVDIAELYDCYTITVLLTIEDSGFCEKGEGMAFVRDHDLSYRGSFPCNTHGGQLGVGQAGMAGGFSQVAEAVRQLRHDVGERQVPHCEVAYVSGTGGIMSEQAALILTAG
jgi:acetyl-CoA acetyltransferase